MGVESSWNASQLYQLDLPYGAKISTEELEFHYHRTGQHAQGPVELRQAWGFNLLVPRTYYANGATTQEHSKHSQPIFNSLLDIFPNTHRKRRFDLKRLSIQPRQTAIVYDYSSFTSLMEEQTYFLRELAKFCRGTLVWIVDTYHGLLQKDLGELIDDYVDHCNDRPEFVLAQSLQDILGFNADIRFHHECAGMLGVNSNLASCTVLHGINLSFTTGSVTSNKCVGDDAIGIIQLDAYEDLEEGEIDDSTREAFIRKLQVVGRIAPEKTRFMLPVYQEPISDSCRWTFLKRWLERYDQELVIGCFINFPPYAFLQRHLETERKMNWDINDNAELLPRLAAQLFGCVRMLSTIFCDDMDRGQYTVAYEYLREFYKMFQLPVDGWVFAEKSAHGRPYFQFSNIACIPSIGHSDVEFVQILRSGPLDYLLKNLLVKDERLYFEVPKVVEGRWSEGIGSHSIASTVTPGLSLARKLGYAERSSIREMVGRDVFVDSFSRFVDSKTSVVYEWTLSTMPDWLMDVLL